MFKVREPNDTRSAVTRAVGMGGLKLFEAEDALAARRQMRDGRTTHRPQPDNDHIMLKRNQVPYFNMAGRRKC